ncbi:MAG: ribosomal-processing cysteine protease Prp [Treponema sp.]|nr:ribosomal-processing cysteine protease Prp [Treponema sp.]
MTKILLAREEGGLRCSASGHAGFAEKGSDIVCAAVTVLLRTAMRLLSKDAQIEFATSLPLCSESDLEESRRGELSFSARVREDLALDEKSSAKIKIAFLADYLSEGFKSLCEEFPRNVEYREN